jgi:alpha-glucosidase
MPMTWDETRTRNAEIGKHITTARRSGTTWFIGSACSEKGVELPIKLDFLEPGATYRATLYEDTPDSHYINCKEAYRIREITVKQGDVLTAKLAPGGGHCMLIEKK